MTGVVVSPLRVLVVDDYDDMRRSLCVLLGLWGHETCAAADGSEALRRAVDFCPDVVLLDLVLPGMSGCEVARRLRQRWDGPPPWLVAMTGCPTPRNLPDALEADFDQYLVKPCDPERLDCLLHSYALARREGSQRLVTSTTSQPR
jgi:two-component system, sensor histidine kinase